ncbi:XPOT [Bugula neritina]|uniref:Exportin-T n=1 Tax=Bugula neritina TaxID=10212 RepID=A0A7J7J8W0_BUGNE|nr:XPOT [Bugula neritina]
MCRFLGDEDDDVSSTVCPFAMSYIGILKRLKPLSDKQKENVQNIMMIVLKKFEFDEDYDFDEEGEDEAMFQDYRKTLKMLFCSIAKMDPTLMLIIVRQMLSSFALLLVYMLGEALPAQQNQHFRDDTKESQEKAEALKEMLKMIIMSEVSHHTHQAVTLQFFETVVRYEKFYHHQPECIPAVLSAFLDERGLRNPRSRVRSRVSYLFTRFIKAVRLYVYMLVYVCLYVYMLVFVCSYDYMLVYVCLYVYMLVYVCSYDYMCIFVCRGNLHQYTENILKQMEGLLTLNTPHSNTIVNGIQPNAAGDTQSWLTNEEQMFLYEVASQLIVNSNLSAQRKSSLMMALLTPVIQDFQTVFNKLCQETDEAVQQSYADCLNCAMSFASRASKGFSNQATMKTCACIPVFTSCLDMFIQALNSPFQRATLQQGVRQFFHRMIVCLEEDILPFVPVMVRLMLETPDAKELYDFIPMLNQLVTKFKVTLAPFLQEAFTPLVTTIYTVLNSPIDSLDTVTMSDRKLLRRGYFTFIANLITSNLTQVIKNQDGATVEQVLTTVIQGCSDLPDPSSQKVCFNILKNLVEQWTNSEDGIMGFDEFTRKNIVPACILAPTKESFDWRDAQTVLLLGDIAGCLHTIYTKQTEVLVQWLVNQYFPSLQLDPSISQSFCTSLTADQKKLKDYLKSFYSNLRDGR